MSEPEDERALSPRDVKEGRQIGEKLAELRRQLREAILRNDLVAEHEIARQLAGLPKERTQ